MLNFFKNLFGSGATETHTNGNGNGHAATSAPAAPVKVQARMVVPQKRTEPVTARPTSPSRPMTPPAAPIADGAGIRLPLYTIISVLPLELKTRIRLTMVADIYVNIPLEQVLVQLGSGVVKITFGELRSMVAPDVFAPQTDLDETEIPLPLNEILPQINPAMIARRQSQRQVQVPEDIHGPFGKDLAGVSLADPRATKPVAPAPSAQAPAPREVKLSPPTPQARPVPPVRPTAAIPVAKPAAPIAPAKPAAPVPPLKPATPIQFNPPKAPAPKAPTPAQVPAPESDPIPMIPFRSSISSTPTPRPPTATPSGSPPVRPSLPSSRGVGATPLPAVASRLPATPSNGNGHPVAARHAQAAPAASAAPDVFLSVPIAALCESWPEVLRSEIEQLNLSEAHVALPVKFIEPALKQGKIAFTWKVLRSWIRPATLPTVSAHDGMVLELPLRIVAPLFLARQKKGSQSNQKVEVDEKIPNLFFGFPQGESAAAAVEEAVAPAPAPAPAVQASEETEANFAPVSKSNGMVDTNFYTWNESSDAPQVDESAAKKTSPGTDFLTRYATPNEVVSRAAALDGVAGALVALPDGLMVASKLSADLNGDTLAAFLPHIFGKVSQCTKELRMGELNNLHFTVGNVPWKIFRVNAIFFAAFGNAGQPLPTAQLAALAGELDRKK